MLFVAKHLANNHHMIKCDPGSLLPLVGHAQLLAAPPQAAVNQPFLEQSKALRWLCCSHENLVHLCGKQRIYQCQPSLQQPHSALGPMPDFTWFHCFCLVMDNSTAATSSGGLLILKYGLKLCHRVRGTLDGQILFHEASCKFLNLTMNFPLLSMNVDNGKTLVLRNKSISHS